MDKRELDLVSETSADAEHRAGLKARAWKAYAEEHSSDLDVNWIRQTAVEAFSAGYRAGYLGAMQE